jgi:hypothetical protein
MRKTSKSSEDKGETTAAKSSKPKKKFGPRIVDITDQFPETSFIITGVEKPKQ